MRLILLVVAIFAAASAYDFNDEVYNHFIREDLEDLQSYQDFEPERLINYRLKREETKPETKPRPIQPIPTYPSPTSSSTESPTSSSEPSSTSSSASSVPLTSTSSSAATHDKCSKKKKFRSCCGEDIMEQVFEKDKELKKECYKEVTGHSKEDRPWGGMDIFNCEKINRTKKEWSCVMQCVGQKKNIFDEDGNIKEKELANFYKKEFSSDEWFLNLVEAALPKCLEHSRNVTFTKIKDDPLSCNSAPSRHHHCMWRELQLTCPDERITDQKLCAKLREKVKKHDDLSFRHVHHVAYDD